MFFKKAHQEIQQLERQEQQGDIELFFCDESGFSLVPEVPYAWQHPDHPYLLPSSHSKRINTLGFLSKTMKFQPYLFESSINSDAVITCFNHFIQKISKKTVVVIDNAPIHKNHNFQKWIPIWEEKGLFLYFLPPYSPELNKIEILWRFIKLRWLPAQAYLSLQNLRLHLDHILKNIGLKYTINFV